MFPGVFSRRNAQANTSPYTKPAGTPHARLTLFQILNLAVVAVSLIVCIFISSEAQKHIDRDVFYIAPVLQDRKYSFTVGELSEISEVMSPAAISYERVDRGIITGDLYHSLNVRSTLVYTNSDYFRVTLADFVDGGAWTASRESENVMVINESLAWQLFGNLHAAGQKASVSGVSYTVIGVVAQGQVARDNCCAFLPAARLASQRAAGLSAGLTAGATQSGAGFTAETSAVAAVLALDEMELDGLFVKASNYNKLGLPHLDSFLRSTGRNRADYYITDINRYLEGFRIKYKIMMLAVSLYLIAVILINSGKLFTRKGMRKGSYTESYTGSYARSYTGSHRGSYTGSRSRTLSAFGFIALLLLDLFFIAALLNNVLFELWIPHGLGGPGSITVGGGFGGRFGELLQGITNIGFLPSGESLLSGLREISRLNNYANIALFLGIAALFNFIFVHRGVDIKRREEHTT